MDCKAMRLQFDGALVARFAELSGATAALHRDEQFALSAGFRSSIVPGMLLVSCLEAILVERSHEQGRLKVSFKKPVALDEAMRLYIHQAVHEDRVVVNGGLVADGEPFEDGEVYLGFEYTYLNFVWPSSEVPPELAADI